MSTIKKRTLTGFVKGHVLAEKCSRRDYVGVPVGGLCVLLGVEMRTGKDTSSQVLCMKRG